MSIVIFEKNFKSQDKNKSKKEWQTWVAKDCTFLTYKSIYNLICRSKKNFFFDQNYLPIKKWVAKMFLKSAGE